MVGQWKRGSWGVVSGPATSPGIQAASRSRKRQRERFSPAASGRSVSQQPLVFSPEKSISVFWPPELLENKSVLFKPTSL